jgi:hypothetical protein
MYGVAYVGVCTNHIRLSMQPQCGMLMCMQCTSDLACVCDIYTNIYAPRDMILTLTLNMVKYNVTYTSSGNVCCIVIVSCS